MRRSVDSLNVLGSDPGGYKGFAAAGFGRPRDLTAVEDDTQIITGKVTSSTFDDVDRNCLNRLDLLDRLWCTISHWSSVGLLAHPRQPLISSICGCSSSFCVLPSSTSFWGTSFSF
jgi:hypothetical protein